MKKLLNLLVAAAIGFSSLGFAQSRDDMIKRIRDKYETRYHLYYDRTEDIVFRNTVRDDSLAYTLSLGLKPIKDNYKKIIPVRLKDYGEMIRGKQESIDSLTALIEESYDIYYQADSLIDILKKEVQPSVRGKLNQDRKLDMKIVERNCILEELARLRVFMDEKKDPYLRGAFNIIEKGVREKYL